MEVHHCIHCGTAAEPSWRFCRRCGTALDNLQDAAITAQCSQCATALAEAWRFCPNCGTDAASAVAPAAASDPAPSAADPVAPPAATATATPEPVEEVATAQVSFEPIEAEESRVPPPAADAPAAPAVSELPPAPPAEPHLDLDVSQPEPPPPPRPEDVPAATATIDVAVSGEPPVEVIRSPAPGPVDDDPLGAAAAAEASPAVTIPPREEQRPRVEPRAIPQPTGRTTTPPEQIPRPMEPAAAGMADSDTRGGLAERLASARVTEAPAEVPRPLERSEEAPARVDDEEPPPIDDRRFRDPGLLSQGVQLAMLATAAIAVAMIVALIVLNNRLQDYATTGESLPRIESAESIINTWMRPLLALGVLGSFIALVLWARRVSSNVGVFNGPVAETAPWMYAIPVANIFVVWQHMGDAWKGSDVYSKGKNDWRRGLGNIWALVFAILATVSIVVVIYAALRSSETFEAAMDANAFSMIGYVLLIGALLTGVRAVGEIVERQRTRVQNSS